MNPRSKTYTVPRHGFTLIEMLLALALGAVVVVAAGRTAILTLQTERAVQTVITRQARPTTCSPPSPPISTPVSMPR